MTLRTSNGFLVARHDACTVTSSCWLVWQVGDTFEMFGGNIQRG